MSSGGCTATTCAKCIDQTDSSNFEACYWDSSKGCYNWFDDPDSSGISTKGGCPSVYVPAIIIGIIAAIIFVTLGVWYVRRVSRRRRNNALLNNNYSGEGTYNNNAIPVSQPNVIVANPKPNMVNPSQYHQVSAGQAIPQQQYEFVQPSMQSAQAPPAEAPPYQMAEGRHTNQ